MLTIDHFATGYARRAPAVLRGENFTLAPGRVTGLLGDNGAGKTTLLRALAGVAPVFTYRRFIYRGRPTTPDAVAFKRRRIAVFTTDHSFLKWRFDTYQHFVEKALGRRAPQPWLATLYDGFSFRPYRRTVLGELSSGNLRKARLIAALGASPEMLLLDEPDDALDAPSQEFLARCLRELADSGRAVLLSTHSPGLRSLVDEPYVLSNGQLRHA